MYLNAKEKYRSLSGGVNFLNWSTVCTRLLVLHNYIYEFVRQNSHFRQFPTLLKFQCSQSTYWVIFCNSSLHQISHFVRVIVLSGCDIDNICFDDIINDIGGFGYWQMSIYFMISSFDVFAAFSLLLPVFIGKFSEVIVSEGEAWRIAKQQKYSQ